MERRERERERKKRNIIIKGIEKGEKEIKEIMTELSKIIEVNPKVKDVKEVGRREERKARMIVVKMEDRDSKIELMKKKALKDRKERLQGDGLGRRRLCN